MSLTVAQLFQPAPSGVGPYGNGVAAVPTTPAQGSWLSVMLEVATQVQLPTTSWQSGAPELTVFSVEAVCFSLSDANISQMAQGGFLQSAAFGTVTYVTVSGVQVTIPVTADPSNTAQNPTGAPGWLDALSQNLYQVQRLANTFAIGPLAIANLKNTSVGPYTAGSYHIANTLSSFTYHNLSSLTIPSSIIGGTGGVVAGVQAGLTFSIITTSSAHGLVPGNAVYINIPQSAGITGLAGVFALVNAVTSTTFNVSVSSSGTWTAGGNVYKCTIASMVADVAGIASNAGPGSVTTAVTQNTNVFIDNIVGWAGTNWESNQALVNRCLNSLAARSPNGPSQAYVYYADTSQQILAAATPAYTLTNGPVIANEFSNPQTGIVYTIVASATPVSTVLGANVTPGVSQLLIASVSNANPAHVTCVGPTTLTTGQSMTVTITGVLGIAGVNGTFVGTFVSANVFSIPVNTVAAGTYTDGGTVEGGDLGAIDALIQRNVVPDNTTAHTTSALAFPITIDATVVVPQAYVAQYQLAVIAQLTAQLATYPIGGNPETIPPNSVPWDDILAALEEAGVTVVGQPSFVIAVQSLSVNGLTTSGTGAIFPSAFYQALLAVPSIIVLGE